MAEPLRLFLVEDDDDVAFVTRRCLERAGHHVTVCHTGADALIVLTHSQFDLVILDYVLQDMKGSTLLQRLHQSNINTPVLMITGHGDEHLAAHVLREGALDYVVKDPSGAYLTELPKRVAESVIRDHLQQTNNLLIAALESAQDGIVITDLHGIVLHVNSALERMFGFSRAELLGQNVVKIFHSEQQTASLNQTIWDSLLDRRSWQGELINKRKDGTLLDTSLTISPICDNRGQMTHFVSIHRDISERKQMERQLIQAQKMQSVGTLAGGVAHEFNNLLAGMQGYATLALREPTLAAPVREFLGHIVQLSDRAADLTRQLLAFARKPSLVRHPTDLVQLLQSTCDLVRHSLNIEVELDVESVPAGRTWVAFADSNQLQQVLVNLSLNARDAMPKPQAAPIIYRLRQRNLVDEQSAFPQNVPPGDYLVIEVQDRGTGMPPEIMAQVLDPFFTTKEVGKGTGLGMPVAFGIINGHQGHLTIESQAHVGTCVALYLPRLLNINPQPVAINTPNNQPEPSLRRRILVVDDEEAVLNVMRHILEIDGHQVLCAASGREALQHLQKSPIDMLILDWMIPKEDGYANFRAVRKVRPNLPILLCTGLLQADQAMELVQAGSVNLLRKPFRMNELWSAVNTCLQRKAPFLGE